MEIMTRLRRAIIASAPVDQANRDKVDQAQLAETKRKAALATLERQLDQVEQLFGEAHGARHA